MTAPPDDAGPLQWDYAKTERNNSRLVREILYSREDRGNQSHPKEENQRDGSSNNRINSAI